MKILGLLFLSLSLLLFGYFSAYRTKSAVKKRNLLLELLLHIQREIKYERTELPLCYDRFNNGKNKVLTDLLKNGQYEEAFRMLSLKEKEKERLLSFFQKLGTGSAKEEELRLSSIIEFLKEIAENEEKALPNKSKLYKTLGICAASVVLLLFI